MRRHDLTNQDLGIRHFRWMRPVAEHRAEAFFKRVSRRYPEDTIEGKEFSVIVGMYHKGSRWAYVDKVAFEPPVNPDPEVKAKLVRPIK